ncbi:MAG: hypothetical protein HXX80_04360 [Nitrososphaerales archaeon]|nr:hypothetical protein [Nitrososphaerales archaeon]
MSAIEKYYRARYEKFKNLLGWRDQLPELLEATKNVLPDAFQEFIKKRHKD